MCFTIALFRVRGRHWLDLTIRHWSAETDDFHFSVDQSVAAASFISSSNAKCNIGNQVTVLPGLAGSAPPLSITASG
jgi:hypothetical protein